MATFQQSWCGGEIDGFKNRTSGTEKFFTQAYFYSRHTLNLRGAKMPQNQLFRSFLYTLRVCDVS